MPDDLTHQGLRGRVLPLIGLIHQDPGHVQVPCSSCVNRSSPSMVNMLQIPKLSTVSTVLKWAALGVNLGFTCNYVVNIY
jgi:hypothetical protein